jgi:hypothetical protein
MASQVDFKKQLVFNMYVALFISFFLFVFSFSLHWFPTVSSFSSTSTSLFFLSFPVFLFLLSLPFLAWLCRFSSLLVRVGMVCRSVPTSRLRPNTPTRQPVNPLARAFVGWVDGWTHYHPPSRWSLFVTFLAHTHMHRTCTCTCTRT